MQSILREITECSTMKDMVENVLRNIRFYVRNRDELADIHYNNEFLQDYAIQLEEVLKMYEKDEIPSWFKEYTPYLFTTSGFPYVSSKLPWVFSFKDFVDILLTKEGEVINDSEILIKGKLLQREQWKELYSHAE